VTRQRHFLIAAELRAWPEKPVPWHRNDLQLSQEKPEAGKSRGSLKKS
jgi:hypothetical protein